MSDLFYPLDESGLAETNKVSEYQSMVTLNNDVRLIVPNAAPFFKGGLKVTHWPSGKELTEDSDFYLGYRYKEMENENNSPIYGAIVFTNIGLEGSFEIEYQTIGGNYVKPQPKVLEYLTNYLTNPRITDWDSVINQPPSQPVKEHRYSHEDHVNLETVESELNNLHDAIERYRQALGEDTFNGLTTRLITLENQMIASQLDAHQHSTSDPHNTTHVQAGALGTAEVAVNAIKAYNKTLNELVQYCYDNGVTQLDLDTLMPLASNHTLLERLILPTTSHIRDEQGRVTFDFGDALADLIAEGTITISADDDVNGNGIASMKAGSNVLEVRSSGTLLDEDGLLYNGSVVLHTGNVKRLMLAVNDTIYYISIVDGPNTESSGNGTTATPLQVDGDLPVATTSVKGETKVSKTVNGDNDKAIASSQLAPLAVAVRNKLSNDTKVNGHFVRASPVLTADDIGLGLIDNTNDMEKPISRPQQQLLDSYDDAGHRHPTSEVNVPLGSANFQGYGAYSADGAAYASSDGELSTINWYAVKYAEALVYSENTLGGVPSDLLPVVSFGTPDYLPIPATGYFGGAGWGGNNYAAVMEAGKRIVAVRAGRDYFGSALYYFIIKLTEDDTVDYYTPLTTQYLPKLKPDEFPVLVQASCETAMVVYTNQARSYLIEFNGTMDATKHRATEVASSYGKMVDCDTHYGFTSANMSSGSGMLINLWLLDKSLLGSTSKIEAVKQTITGLRHNGTSHSAEDFFYVTGQKKAADATGNDLVVVTDDFSWGGNVRHATQNILVGYEDGKVRIYYFQRPYYSRSSGSIYGGTWEMSCTIDLRSSNRVTMDFVPDFPITINNSGQFDFGNLRHIGGGAYPGGTPNNVSFGNQLGDGYEIYNSNYGTQNTPYLYVMKRAVQGRSWFESLHANQRESVGVGNAPFIGKTFSGIPFGTRVFCPLIGSRAIIRAGSGLPMIAVLITDSYYPGQGDKSFGYSPDSEMSTDAICNELSRIPYTFTSSNFDGSIPASEEQKGATWWEGNLSCNWSWDDNGFSGTATLAQSVYDALVAWGREEAKKVADETEVDVMLFVYSTGIPEVPMFFQFGRMTEIGNGSRRLVTVHGTFDANSRQNPTSITVQPSLAWANTVLTTVRGLGVSFHAMEGVQVGKMKDGRYAITCNNGLVCSYVGNSGNRVFGFMVQPNSYDVEDFYQSMSHYYQNDGYRVLGTKGIYAVGRGSGGTTMTGTWCDQDWSGVSSGHVLWSSVATGNWAFFITDEVLTYAKGGSNSLAAVDFDLEELFPTNHQNNTFYLYFIHTDKDSHGYDLVTEKTIDTAESTYLGYVTTDENGITDLDIRTILKWGTLKELAEHEADKGAHGYGAIDKSTFNLDLIENKAPTNVLNPPTFKEVFDTWYRFSHNHSNNRTPYLPNEMTAWSYSEANDSISCTINSSSFIGFVSPEPYTDYEFDTYISSTNSDDDSIGIVLAFEIDEYGYEHALVLCRVLESQHAETGDTAYIYHRHVTPEGVLTTTRIYTFDGKPLNYDWSQAGRSRLQAFRSGDVYTIKMYSFELIENVDLTSVVDTITLNLNDYANMEIFKGSSRFGYVCQSQTSSTWANIKRPDSDGRSYYGTNELLHNAYHGWGDARIGVKDNTFEWENPDNNQFDTPKMAFELPPGYSATDCDLKVSFNGWDMGAPGNGLAKAQVFIDDDAGTYWFRLKAYVPVSVPRVNVSYTTYVIARPSRIE